MTALKMEKLMNEINRWLGVKWTQPKYNKYLPTVPDAAKYANECLEKRMRNMDGSFTNKLRRIANA